MWKCAVERAECGKEAPGTIIGVDKSGIHVACGSDALILKEVQLEGKKRMETCLLYTSRCKSMLLRQCRVGIVNRDDEHFERIIEGHTCQLETYGFSPEADLRAEDAHMVGGKGYLGISYQLKGLMEFPVEIDIPGKFSIYNSLTAIAICRHFNVSQENIIKALKVARVKGRIEVIKVSDEFTLMIDYAQDVYKRQHQP